VGRGLLSAYKGYGIKRKKREKIHRLLESGRGEKRKVGDWKLGGM